jgi:aldose 1-epimerase
VVQIELHAAEVTASVNSRGASLRTLVVHGAEHVPAYAGDAPPLMSGVVMVPWPNRVRDGRWTLDGCLQQLAINEPAAHNAIHGLMADFDYTAEDVEPHRVVFRGRVDPAPGYPFSLNTTVEYRLTCTGIEVLHRITNISTRVAPVALGVHPYLAIQPIGSSEPRFTLLAQVFTSLDRRNLPERTGSAFEAFPLLRTGLPLSKMPSHGTFSGFPEGAASRTARLTRGAVTTLMWWSEAFRHLHVYRVDHFPSSRGPVSALALEPMSAPIDGLSTGQDLVWLPPGHSWEASWGIETAAVDSSI